MSFVSDRPVEAVFHCTAKFRYRQEDVGVTVHLLEGNKANVIFDEPARAVTPGQALVLYDGDICLGGGTIDEIYKQDVQLRYVG
ncbi:tRNA-specific 2-thiouridylase MnmA [Listeria grandensis FSL F6-0971]|nr:tRNA-specific 2-thiouridylase MnmA [Listeria grandensis FSL F6-0971]